VKKEPKLDQDKFMAVDLLKNDLLEHSPKKLTKVILQQL
jgi:hypothetical protein